MKSSEFKKLIKPLVKECIQEALLEEGLLSNVISEVVKGLNTRPLVESVEQEDPKEERNRLAQEEIERRKAKINESRQKITKAVGGNSYNGVDLFEGTTPMAGNHGPQHGALTGTEPGDAGVDISNLMGNKRVWNVLLEGKK